MNYNQYQIDTSIWLYPGKAAWYFATIPPDVSADISKEFDHLKRGWGSLKVKATIGATTWETSIFPDKKSGGYLLPIKTAVRKSAHIRENDKFTILLEIKT